jgi:hypothetical protein
MSNSLELPGFSLSSEPSNFDLLLSNSDALLSDLVNYFVERRNLTLTTSNLFFYLKLDVLTNQNGKTLITRPAFMTGAGSFVSAAEEYITDYLALVNRNNISYTLFVNHNSGTEFSPSSIVFYRTVISPCDLNCPTIPSSARNITIRGQGFGSSVSALSVRLASDGSVQPVGDCVVIEAADTKLVCRTTSVLPIGRLSATVFRGSRPTFYSAWMISLPRAFYVFPTILIFFMRSLTTFPATQE